MVMIPFDDRIKIERYLKEKGVYNKAYDSDLDGVINLDSVPTIPRTKLEYPTENVTFVYLAAIDKMETFGGTGSRPSAYGTFTVEEFTDKAVDGVMRAYNEQGHWGRWVDPKNWYENTIHVAAASNDHKISTIINGVRTIVASESIDLSGYTHPLRLDIIGSTIKSTRDWAATPQLVVTDTTFVIGKFGSFSPASYYNDTFDYLGGKLIPPASQGVKALTLVEVELKPIDELGRTLEPNLPKNLVKIQKGMNVPEELFLEVKKYEMLKNKGFTDEEIELLLGNLPQLYIDTLSITYGAFEPSSGEPLVIAIYGDNYYKRGAISEVLNYVRSKGLKKYKVPENRSEAREIIKELKKDGRDFIAGTDNLMYQVSGIPEYEYFAVADYYDGFAEGIYDDKLLDRLPDKVIVNADDFRIKGRVVSERTLQISRSIKRIKQSSAPETIKEQHLKKIVKFLKR